MAREQVAPCVSHCASRLGVMDWNLYKERGKKEDGVKQTGVCVFVLCLSLFLSALFSCFLIFSLSSLYPFLSPFLIIN